MNDFEIRGYSERGMINALVHEMGYSPYGIPMIKDLLKCCVFPFRPPGPRFSLSSSLSWSRWVRRKLDEQSIPGSVTVAQETLALFVQVRILAG